MLKYSDFVVMIKDGLITTHNLNKCDSIIDRTLSDLKIWYNVEFNYNDGLFKVLFEETLNENQLEYMFHIFNNLGYYISYYKIYNTKKMVKSFPWISVNLFLKESKNKDKCELFFDSKYDEELKYKPDNLYHVTKIENLNKIKKNGLIPKYDKKGDWRLDRIYFSLNKKDVFKIKEQNEFRDKMYGNNFKYVVLEIDINNIGNLKLYKDPRSSGVYTYNHFNPKSITLI
jgi:hypothetical protein